MAVLGENVDASFMLDETGVKERLQRYPRVIVVERSSATLSQNTTAVFRLCDPVASNCPNGNLDLVPAHFRRVTYTARYETSALHESPLVYLRKGVD